MMATREELELIFHRHTEFIATYGTISSKQNTKIQNKTVKPQKLAVQLLNTE